MPEVFEKIYKSKIVNYKHFDSKFEIAFPLEKEVLNSPVKVSRLLRTGDIYNGMGIEIICTSQEMR